MAFAPLKLRPNGAIQIYYYYYYYYYYYDLPGDLPGAAAPVPEDPQKHVRP